MTRKEALEWFTLLKVQFANTEYEQALDMAIEALSNEEQSKHKMFVIGETCVEESKAHIEPHDAIEKIRKVLRGEL